MAYNNKKGYDGEIEARDFFATVYSSDIWERIGGKEFDKKFLGGDISIVPLKKCVGGVKKPARAPEESPAYPLFVEVKNQANPNVWGVIEKAEDDMKMFGKNMAVLYAIKHKKGEVGERLVCMRPRTLKYLIESGK